MSEHTPGPWQGVEHPDGRFRIDGPYPPGKFVADLPRDYGTLEERRANARLIAAAPELLEAAKKITHGSGAGHQGGHLPYDCELCAAIAKAEGNEAPHGS